MKKQSKKLLLALVAVGCLTPAAGAVDFVTNSCPAPSVVAEQVTRNCVTAPEGGTAAIYLLGAALTCFAAMFLRSKLAKPTQS
jgi:hypothetical protein